MTTTGAELIAAERQRQIDVEGYTPEHDRGHMARTPLLAAARCYLAAPGTIERVRELVKAGALIAAEIDRLHAASAVQS